MIALIRPFPEPLQDLYSWQMGDHVTHLDGRAIEDILDLYYYTPDDETTVLTIQRRDTTSLEVELDPEDIPALTDCFAPLEFKTCACQCVFCFIDQNPAGMRDQIYIKDEDYRFSFLYGNYITLTSLGKRGVRRIIEQQMSPLYVSVHATDIDVRTKLLGISRRIDVVALLQELADAGIELHTQVVLCPGWNDGPVLQQTFEELLALAPAHEGKGGVRSLAIVPVGLTAHRQGLTPLEPVTQELAAAVVAQAEHWQEACRQKLGHTFIYLSDEFYLLAEKPFPPVEQYDGLWQVDNAIGLTPQLAQTWAMDLEVAAAAGRSPSLPVTILTGELAATAWRREFLPLLNRAGTPAVEVLLVANHFYGPAVTVAGLLAGQDLRRSLLALPAEPIRQVLLSPRVFNTDSLTLDGLALADIAAGQPHPVHMAAEEGFVDFWLDLG